MPDGSGSVSEVWPIDGSAARSNVRVLDPLAHEGRDVLLEMASALEALSRRVNGAFGRAVRLLRDVRGHVVVTGLGKSGLVGRKIAATLASTGTPSFFVHSGEAFHGDLGMIREQDAVILISYSGETQEVAGLVPHLRRRGVRTVALVGKLDSALGRSADVAIDVSVEREVCPNNLAPTSSTLATLAMGDAIAVALTRLRGFGAEDFARLHPGGSLGRRLSSVRDVMSRDPLPIVQVGEDVRACALALATATVPFVLVLDHHRLVGTVGAAELREALREPDSCLDRPVTAIMSSDPPVVAADALVADAERRMAHHGHKALVVIDDQHRVCGLFLGR